MSSKKLVIGRIIHIGKTFESYNGVDLTNRFMCIIGVEQGNILMLPMSTFHDEKHKTKKLSFKTNFEYSINHGNTRNGYIKCNQLYSLSIDDFNKFPEEIQLKHKMNSEHFSQLISHLKELKEKDEINLEKTNIKFKDQNEEIIELEK